MDIVICSEWLDNSPFVTFSCTWWLMERGMNIHGCVQTGKAITGCLPLVFNFMNLLVYLLGWECFNGKNSVVSVSSCLQRHSPGTTQHQFFLCHQENTNILYIKEPSHKSHNGLQWFHSVVLGVNQKSVPTGLLKTSLHFILLSPGDAQINFLPQERGIRSCAEGGSNTSRPSTKLQQIVYS